ncbi:MAG: hypothetical protein KGI89_15680 [Euryarchaeota archaeon]|nr:hypothetical protein [Euryarchaeota archaeon]
MSGVEKGVTLFLGGLITIAILTTLVGKGKQTPQVINAGGTAISHTLLAAQGL